MKHRRLRSRLLIWMAFLLLFGGSLVSAQTLRLATWQWNDPAYAPFWTGTTDAFMKANPGVTIKPFNFPIDQLWNRLNVQIAAGSPPDLIEVTGFNVFQYMHEGVLAPLNKCFEGTDIVKNVAHEDSYAVDDQGNIYALNLSSRSLALFVNRQLFDEAGVKVPTNFAEFEAAAKALTDPSKGQYGLVLTNLPHSRFYESLLDMVAGYGGSFTKDRKPDFTSPEVIKGITFFKKLFDEGVMPKGVKDAGAQYSYFDSGKVAMTIDGPWFWAAMEQQAPDLVKHVEVYPIPTDTQATTGGINNLIGIAAKSPNYDLACQYLKSIANAKWGQVWTENSGTIYPYKGSIPSDYLKKNPWFKTFADYAGHEVPVAPPGLELYFNDIQLMIVKKGADILYNNEPVAQAMQELQNEVEQYLEDHQQ